MIRQTLLFLFILLTLSSHALQASDATEKSYRAISSVGNVYELHIASEAAEIMKPLPVKIIVSTQEGLPISGAKIICSLTMPAMAMPSNNPPIKETDAVGQYESVFLLTMGGLWHVELSSVYSSGEQDTTLMTLPMATSGQSKDKTVETQLEELFHKQGEPELK